MAAFVIPIVSSVISLITQHGQALSRDRYETAVSQHRAGALHDLIDAAYHKRFDLIRSGFETIIGQFGIQAASYLEQLQQYTKMELDCDDAIRRLEIRSRMREIDKELQIIRIDAQLLYSQMTHALSALDVPSLEFARDYIAPLSLPSSGGFHG